MSNPGKPRVLVVDDEEGIRDSIELLMSSEGLVVDAVADADACLKQIETESYDLVLLDLMLPGRSGLDVQKELKIIDPSLPVIILTAMAVV